MSPPWKIISAVIFSLGFLVVGFYAGQVSPNVIPFQSSRPVAASGNALHEVWILPITTMTSKHKPAKTRALLTQVNTTLDWYATASDSRTVFVATKVFNTARLPRIRIDSEEDDCNVLSDAVQAAAKEAPENVTVIGLVSGKWKCGYSGLAGIGDNWALVLGYDPSTLFYPERTVIHELGHTLGLGHAKVFLCPILSSDEWTTDPVDCSMKEYGDAADPMGGPKLSASPSFNALNRHALGWGEKIDEPLVISEPGEYTIFLSALTLPGPDYIILPDNLYVSYRSATSEQGNIDNVLSSAGNSPRRESDKYAYTRRATNVEGVYLYTTRSDEEDNVEASVSLPFLNERPGGKEGEHYVSYDKHVAIRVDETVEGEGVYLTVRIAESGETISDEWGPAVSTMTQKVATNLTLVHWAALDPSGIYSYTVRYGTDVTVLTPEERMVQLKIKEGKPDFVVLTVTDRAGNSTTQNIDITKDTLSVGFR